MPNTLHNITLLVMTAVLCLAITYGVRIVSYKVMYEDQVRETVLEVLEVLEEGK